MAKLSLQPLVRSTSWDSWDTWNEPVQPTGSAFPVAPFSESLVSVMEAEAACHSLVLVISIQTFKMLIDLGETHKYKRKQLMAISGTSLSFCLLYWPVQSLLTKAKPSPSSTPSSPSTPSTWRKGPCTHELREIQIFETLGCIQLCGEILWVQVHKRMCYYIHFVVQQALHCFAFACFMKGVAA